AVQRQPPLLLAALIQVHLWCGPAGCRLTRIDHDAEVVRSTPQQEEAATTKSRRIGLDHGERRGNRDCCIECIAALVENFLPGPGSQRMCGGNRLLRRVR